MTSSAFAGLGVDLTDIGRFRNARFLERVEEYVLTSSERDACHASRDAVEFLASRFAVKEAVIKATPFPLTYLDIETSKQGSVPIAEYLLATCRDQFQAHVSLSHAPEYAVGAAVVFRRDTSPSA